MCMKYVLSDKMYGIGVHFVKFLQKNILKIKNYASRVICLHLAMHLFEQGKWQIFRLLKWKIGFTT